MKKLIGKLEDYTKRTDVIYPPLLWNEWGVEPEQLSKAIASIWWRLPNPIIYEDHIKIDYDNPAKFYEICDTKYRRGRVIKDHKLPNFCLLNQKEDQHISVYRHDQTWIDNVRKTGTVTCSNTIISPEYVYLELDRDDVGDAINDALIIYDNFPHKEAIRLYLSGNRSIHIEINMSVFGGVVGRQSKIAGIGRLMYNLAHRISGDIRHNNGVADVYNLSPNEAHKLYYETFGIVPDKRDLQKIRSRLENIDPNLYRTNSLIRQPWSIHEKTNRKKIMVTPEQLRGKKIDVDKNKLDFLRKSSYLPYMLHWTIECSKLKQKPKPKSLVSNTNIVVEEFSKHIDGFDISTANEKGYVDGLYSPFYDDTNPSVGVNIKTGFYTDFGEPNDFMDFYEFYSRIHDVSREEAIKIIKEKDNVHHN